MDNVKCNLKNCFGISSLRYDFDFSSCNVVSIYARNGLMKTSFSKTFKSIQDNKDSEIKDVIYDLSGKADITFDGQKITSEEIFVIKSFESFYECSNISSLLVDDKIKVQIENLLKLKGKFLKYLEKSSGLKIKRKSQGKDVFELEPTIVEDFKFEEKSFLLNVKKINDMTPSHYFEKILYTDIFDKTILNKIKKEEFQTKIKDFCAASDKIYKEYGFLDKGRFTLPKLKNLAKQLESNNFFTKNNGLYLDGLDIKNSSQLTQRIDEVENKIKQVPEFKAIENLLSDSKGIRLRDVIENNYELISFLNIDKLNDLKKQLWLSYIHLYKNEFKHLIEEYGKLENSLSKINLDSTQWQEALNIFKERFTVPYEMKIANLKGSIIGESVPKVEFAFTKNGNEKRMTRATLEEKDILSQGEKRSLYLLNIIFDIENIRRTGRKVLFIIDDIADSFDYKNKYAIVEYLYDLSKSPNFRLIVLSHNFDFYRTVSSRLNIPRENRRFATKINGEIILEEEKYQNQPFKTWANNLNYEHIIALIPFVRNLCDFGFDRKVCKIGSIEKDFDVFTNLLHDKNQSRAITFDHLKQLYNEYLGKNKFLKEIHLDELVVDKIFEVANKIDKSDSLLEHKLILAIAIRLKAEKYMKSKLEQFPDEIKWTEKNKNIKIGPTTEFLESLNNCRNQTRNLFEAYKQISKNNIEILEEVNIMTPENIHLNSFMYEPILDMDIFELLNLYDKIKMIK